MLLYRYVPDSIWFLKIPIIFRPFSFFLGPFHRKCVASMILLRRVASRLQFHILYLNFCESVSNFKGIALFVIKILFQRNKLLAFLVRQRISVSGLKSSVMQHPKYIKLSTCSIRLFIIILVLTFLLLYFRFYFLSCFLNLKYFFLSTCWKEWERVNLFAFPTFFVRNTGGQFIF